MDPIDFLRTVRGRWRIIVLTCLVGVLAGWVTTPGRAEHASTTGVVTATHVLLADRGDETGQQGSQSVQDLETAALLATVGEVPKQVAAELGADPAALLGSLTVTAEPSRRTISISATDDDPARAAVVANTFAAELQEHLAAKAQDLYEADLAEALKIRDSLQAELAGLPEAPNPNTSSGRQQEALVQRLASASEAVSTLESAGAPGPGFDTIAEASPEGAIPGGPRTDAGREDAGRRSGGSDTGGTTVQVRPAEDPPDRAARMGIGGAVGLVLGIGLALLRERLDARIRTKDAAEAAFGLPVLAEIPPQTRQQRRRLEIASAGNGRHAEAEAYRVLRTSLLFAREPAAVDATGAAATASEHRNGSGDSRRGGRDGSPSTVLAGPLETVEQLRRATRGLPVLGVIPPLDSWTDPSQARLASRSDPVSPAAAAYRSLRSPLQHLGLTSWLRTLRVTSAMTGEGRTATAANLGLVLARAGHRVTLVDCDFRHPRLHSFFGLPNDVGLASMVSGEVSVSATCQAVPGEERLTVVASGPAPDDPTALLASPRTAEVLAALAVQSDIVILDTAPVVADDAASALSGLVDATVVVASRGTTSGNRLQQALAVLARSGAPLAGIIFNKAFPSAEVFSGAGDDSRSEAGPYRSLADHIPDEAADGRSSPERTLDVVLITSPGAEEGKTSTALNLAAALGETGTSVLALDFDLRRPSIHEVFDLPSAPGLTEALDQRGSVPLHEIVRPTSVPNVVVIPSGTLVTDPAGLLPRGRDLVARARTEAEVIIVDTPPLLAASDASQLTPAADAVVVVCRAGRTSVHAAARCAEQLSRLGAPVLGVVLTAAPDETAYGSYYYDDTLLKRSRWRFWRRSQGRPVPTEGVAVAGTSRPDGPSKIETAVPAPSAGSKNAKDAKNGKKAGSRPGSHKKGRGKMANQRT